MSLGAVAGLVALGGAFLAVSYLGKEPGQVPPATANAFALNEPTAPTPSAKEAVTPPTPTGPAVANPKPEAQPKPEPSNPAPQSAELPQIPPNVPPVAGQPLQHWVQALKDANAAVRLQAMQNLAKAGGHAAWALPQLHHVLLYDTDAKVRREAARAIGRAGSYGKAAMPAILEVFGDPTEDYAVRAACAEAINQLPVDESALPALLAAFDKPESSHVLTIVPVFSRLGPAAVPGLVKALDLPNQESRFAAIVAIARIGRQAEPAFARVREVLLKDPDSEIRRLAAGVLVTINPKAEGLTDLFTKLLKDPSENVRFGALEGLSRLGPAAAVAQGEVTALLRDSQPTVRLQAARALRLIGQPTPDAGPTLIALVQDENAGVRREAVRALARIEKDPAIAVPALRAALKTKDMELTQYAVHCLGHYGPASAEAIPELLEMLKVPRGVLPAQAQTTLSRLGAPAAKALGNALQDESATVRVRAAEVLTRMGDPATEALPAMRVALQDREVAVRKAALEALESLGAKARPASAEILALVRDPDAKVRALLPRAVNAIGLKEKDIRTLAELARQEDLKVREAAIQTLVAAGKPAQATFEQLAEELEPQSASLVNQARAEANRNQVVQRHLDDLHAEEAAVRFAALLSLVQHRRLLPQVLDGLIVMLKDKDADNRQKAAQAILQFGSQRATPEVIQALAQAVVEASEDNRKSLGDVLARLDGLTATDYGVSIQYPDYPVQVIPTPPTYASLPGRRPTGTPQPMPATPADRSDDPAVRTVVRLLVPRAAGGQVPAVTVLERPTETLPPPNGYFRGIVARELVRQALLLAAREELGLATRDLSMRETFSAADYEEKARLILTSTIVAQKSAQVSLHRENNPEPIWKAEVLLANEPLFDYGQLTEGMERLARTELPGVLAKAGFPREATKQAGQTTTPAATAQRIAELNLWQQFAALRELHTAVRMHGESPQLAADRVRAYANLAVLTDDFWNPIPKILKARALLYAQRLVAADPQSPWGLWHRAYAKALAGLPAASLHDLSAADKLAGAQPGGPARPEWVDLLDACGRFDQQRLATIAPKQGQLGRLLRFLLVEDLTCREQTFQAAGEVLRDNPECYRVVESAGAIAGVSAGHQLTQLGLAVLSRTMASRLRQMPGVPATIIKQLPADEDDFELRTEAAVVRSLIDASGLAQDRGELAWSSLGSLILETRFLQVNRRLLFMKYLWGVPLQGFLVAARPLYESHPYRIALEMHTLADPEMPPDAVRKAILAVIDPSELEWPRTGNLAVFADTVDFRGNGARVLLTGQHGDHLYFEMLHRFRWDPQREMERTLPYLQLLGAGSPQVRAQLIKHSWPTVASEAAAWEKEGSVLILGALGQRYAELKQDDAAERCLRRFLDKSPDEWAYDRLAAIYKARNQTDKWLATLEEFLTKEDFGLGHARVRVEIAQYYMAKQDYRKALPYAEAAGATGAAWALKCLADCYTKLEEWDRAEGPLKALSERYPDCAFDWYYWCLAHGRGHYRAAAAAAVEAYRAAEAPFPKEREDILAEHLLMENQLDQALPLWRKSAEKDNRPVSWLYVAMIADHLGNKAERDAAWKKIPAEKLSGRLAKLFQEAVARPKEELDLKAVEDLLAAADKEKAPDWKPEAQYFVGRFLQCRGQFDQARAYYQQAVTSKHHLINAWWLAREALRELEAKKEP